MLKEIIKTGRTVDDAINSACKDLGCEREDCEWKIIDLPKRGFLGFKNTPAKVSVSFEVKQSAPTEDKPPSPSPAPAAVETQKPPQKPPQPVRAERVLPTPPPVYAAEQTGTTGQVSIADKALLGKRYLDAVLTAAELPGGFEIKDEWEEDGGVLFRVTGESLGLIIGRRGDTLDGLQYLVGLVANRVDGDYLRVTVDAGDYRVKRRATLENLAQKLSAQVLRTETSKVLEPMNPFERRVIHAAISEIGGVYSTSIGDEPNRRVVITSPAARQRRQEMFKNREKQSRAQYTPKSPAPTPAKAQSTPLPSHSTHGSTPISERPAWPDKGAVGDRPDDRAVPPRRTPPRSDYSGKRGERRERPAPYKPTKDKPDNPPKEAENKPLYGKIDLE